MNSLGNTKLHECVQRLHRNDASLKILNLCNEDIGDEGATALANALQVNTSLQNLCLNRSNIGDDGAAELAKALLVNRSLTKILLYGNNIGDKGATALAKALQVNKFLGCIGLIGNKIGDKGATAWANALQINTSLTWIDLSGNNNICDEGATALAQALQVNTTLVFINLAGNKIGDEGATALAKALQVNTTLGFIYLAGNKIGDEGATALAKALQFNKSVTAIDLTGNNVGDEGAMRLLETLENHNGTLVKLSLTHDLQSPINELVNANINGTRNPPPPSNVNMVRTALPSQVGFGFGDPPSNVNMVRTALPSQVGFGFGDPPSNVNMDQYIDLSNANMMARAIERNRDASDAVFPKNTHCFDAHVFDPENKTKVFEASLDLNDCKNKQLAVFAAIFYEYIEDLEHELSEDNVDLNGLDSRNRTCADFAAVMGRLDMVQLILEKGGTFGILARSVMMPLARERDAARTKSDEE
jgi:Ran GTPase-activating protein (RanGAP) involved in mRNA processing and transport